MKSNEVKIGFDRFLANEWANYSLELYLSSEDDENNYHLLKNYLHQEISGKETARKTGNQLKRMWLISSDKEDFLRKSAKHILLNHHVTNINVFNLGMALNAFPVFKETCRRIGELSALQKEVYKRTIEERVMEQYLTPTSIPRIVARVLQTLKDWGFISTQKDSITNIPLIIKEELVANWFIYSLLQMNTREELLLNELIFLPEKLGVMIPNIRDHLINTPNISIRRGFAGEEIVSIKK